MNKSSFFTKERSAPVYQCFGHPVKIVPLHIDIASADMNCESNRFDKGDSTNTQTYQMPEATRDVHHSVASFPLTKGHRQPKL
jgi:hypothetical protein